MHKVEDKHLFAVYVGDLFLKQSVTPHVTVTISDENVVHRIVIVLRMQMGDQIHLFDDKNNYLCTIADIKKAKALTVQIDSVSQNSKPRLEINVVLPVLKKEALEETLYSLTEIGATTIHLVMTAKSQKQLTDKELVRLDKMRIAAAEQSKNFSMPTVVAPITLEKFCSGFNPAGFPAVLFDPSGRPAFELIDELKQKPIHAIFCAMGPEGGFTQSEIQLLANHGFVLCKLTPTILRALQAAAIGTGLLASLL